MTSKLIPTYIFNDVIEIKPEFIKSINIKGLLIDLDGTLESSKTIKPSEKILVWLASLESNNIEFAIVSNNNEGRVSEFCKDTNIKFLSEAMKPFKSGIKKGLELLNMRAIDVMMVGDQIFTDVLGGNKMGLKTAYIYSIDLDEKHIAFRHKFEKRYIRRCKHNGQNNISNWRS